MVYLFDIPDDVPAAVAKLHFLPGNRYDQRPSFIQPHRTSFTFCIRHDPLLRGDIHVLLEIPGPERPAADDDYYSDGGCIGHCNAIL